eukprot:TRINITY_DN6765_c0_g3_i1.p1 TRINITY_DN6765_c0_g3~~TRINITY_DN6765_c0_g3_i1.p1  ORF type:complete len:705 (-),score=153.12 TRINITY_DN6765_c0_g3_i1:98-1966(-)
MFQHCFHPRIIKSINFQEPYLSDVWTNVLQGTPITFRSWGMLFRYFRYSSALSTTLYIIREHDLASRFDYFIIRMIKILSKNTVPTEIVQYFTRVLIFLRYEGKVDSELRGEALRLIDSEKLMEKLIGGVKKDKVNVYLVHFLGAMYHHDNVCYHLREMKTVEPLLPLELVIYVRYTILDCWSYLFIHHGVASLRAIGLTPELFYWNLEDLKSFFQLHSSAISSISEEWVGWYAALIECKMAIYCSYIVCKPFEALQCISNLLEMRLPSLAKNIIVQLPVLMHISSFYGSPSLYGELKREFEKFSFVPEMYYLKKMCNFPPPLRITLEEQVRSHLPMQCSISENVITLEPARAFEGLWRTERELSSYDDFNDMTPLEDPTKSAKRKYQAIDNRACPPAAIERAEANKPIGKELTYHNYNFQRDHNYYQTEFPLQEKETVETNYPSKQKEQILQRDKKAQQRDQNHNLSQHLHKHKETSHYYTPYHIPDNNSQQRDHKHLQKDTSLHHPHQKEQEQEIEGSYHLHQRHNLLYRTGEHQEAYPNSSPDNEELVAESSSEPHSETSTEHAQEVDNDLLQVVQCQLQISHLQDLLQANPDQPHLHQQLQTHLQFLQNFQSNHKIFH